MSRRTTYGQRGKKPLHPHIAVQACSYAPSKKRSAFCRSSHRPKAIPLLSTPWMIHFAIQGTVSSAFYSAGRYSGILLQTVAVPTIAPPLIQSQPGLIDPEARDSPRHRFLVSHQTYFPRRSPTTTH